MTAGEAVVVFLALIIEVVLWGVLWIVELIVCLFTWRKPKMVPSQAYILESLSTKIWRTRMINSDLS